MHTHKRIGIIGAPCLDEIIYVNGVKSASMLGGIFYSYAALERVAAQNHYDVTFYPITYLSIPDRDLLEPFISRLTYFDFSFTPWTEHCSNRVELRYLLDGTRQEHCSVILPSLDINDINIDLLRSLDGILINMISGHDIHIETAEWIRSHSAALIHLDVHSLTLGDLGQRRRYTPVNNWLRWAIASDSVQMNEREALNFPPPTSEPYIKQLRNAIHDSRERSVILTRGDKNIIGYDINNSMKFSIPVADVRIVDTTGSGDVFGAVFLLERVMGRSLFDSVQTASDWATLNTQYSGVFELLG
jgi:hypothetical protein